MFEELMVDDIEENEDEVEDDRVEVCQVCSPEQWVKIKRSEVTVDSAAEESAAPLEWGDHVEIVPKVGKGIRMVAANGSDIKHYGSRRPKFQPKVSSKIDQVVDMEFQVSDVMKPLVAVRRIVESGNKVHFGPEEADNYIENVKSGEWIQMRKKNGSYVIDIDFVVKNEEVSAVFQRRD